MQLVDGVPVYSATDLVGYLACEHLTNLERAALARLVKRPVRPDPELDLLAQRGLEHERRFLQSLQEDGLTVAEIDLEENNPAGAGRQLSSAVEATKAAMLRGEDVIYQATLFDGRWRGHTDFLRKVDTRSTLGAHSYEVWDTKLARHTKGSTILQLCLYSDLLAALQGRQPELMHVALGGSTVTVEHHRFADYGAYYRMVRSRFDEFVSSTEATYPPTTRPDPVEHCDVCRWSIECTSERRRTDDLSLVAGITSRQRRALRAQGVDSRGTLAALPLPFETTPEGTTRESLTRVREQARIQVAGDNVRPTVLYELIEPARTRAGELEPNRGLLVLPEPSPGDLFLDLEGDPYAFGDGIDYLFGVIEPAIRNAKGEAAYTAFWSRDQAGDISLEGEKAAFEACIDFIVSRIQRDPNLHVFHYAPYEPTAFGRLMGRHATREEEVDRLLRGGYLVDLFRAVRQGVRASVESYSIKRLERLYGFERAIDLRDAGSSIAAFETWLELGEGLATSSGILARIQGYNRDDCISNMQLRNWLEVRRVELADRLKIPLPRPAIESADPKEEAARTMERLGALGRRLTDAIPTAASERAPDQQASWLIAQLLSWHRREEKSTWWRYFYLMDDLTDEERFGEPDALGLLNHETSTETARSITHRYRFPPQEHAIVVGTDVRDPSTKERAGVVIAVDNIAGTIDVRRAKTSAAPHPTSLVPLEYVSTNEHRASLERIGAWVADHGIDSPGSYRAARDLLMRRPPRLDEARGATSAAPSELSRRVCERALALDHSYLAIQGPPGSGKTTIGAEMIVDLVTSGQRVGVTANSHKVIGNLLDKVAEIAKKRGARVRMGQKPASGEKCTCGEATPIDTNSLVRQSLEAGEIDVVGATTWTWARDEMTERLDYLLVDEAGQMSLANVLAVSSAARNVILLGDPQQLDQPLQGVHPPGAERSALAHLLDGRPTVPSELGVLLEETWRLHPDICAFTSEVFYEGRLRPARGTEAQHVDVPDWGVGQGLRYVKVEHFGNHNESEEEAASVAQLVSDLITPPRPRGPTRLPRATPCPRKMS